MREFWCTAVVTNPDAPKEATIRFSVKNGTKFLTLNYKTFVKATGLDFAETFAKPPTEEEVRELLLTLGPYDKNHPDVSPGALLSRAPIIKMWFPAPWRILMTFVIQVLGGNKSSTEQLNTTQSMIVFCLMEGRKIDLGEIIFRDLIAKLSGKSRQKLMSYPRFISCSLQDLLGSEYAKPEVVSFEPDVLHKANYSRDPLEVTPVALTTYMLSAIQGDKVVSPVPSPTKKVKRKKGQGSRKVAQPKSLDTETSDPKPTKRGQQQPPLTADTLRIITQSLGLQQKPTEGTETSHSVSSGEPVPKGPADTYKLVKSEPTKPSHPANDSGKSQPEPQGIRGPKPSVEQHYSTEKGIHKQSHPAKGRDKS